MIAPWETRLTPAEREEIDALMRGPVAEYGPQDRDRAGRAIYSPKRPLRERSI